MKVIDALHDLRQWRKQTAKTIALVPTMGNLHQGHLQLVKRARELGEQVVVSIFVNPMQFAAHEDLDRYPRTFDADCKALAEAGADVVFAPSVEDVYPRGLAEQTAITVPHISDILCGASRPGHFTGVATIVAKLFNMVQPQVAIFGEKDYQQLQVIRLMTQDLSLPVDVVGEPTMRATDGLALSSRNGYLSEQERQQAPILYQLLQACAQQLSHGDAPAQVEQRGIKTLTRAGFKVDYLVIRRAQDLQAPHTNDKDLVVLVAAYLGTTRLIDNLQTASV